MSKDQTVITSKFGRHAASLEMSLYGDHLLVLFHRNEAATFLGEQEIKDLKKLLEEYPLR